MGLLSFLFLSGIIGPGVRHILDVVAPRIDIHASGGACFVCWSRDEYLGVEWGFCLCLGTGFSRGG